MSMSNLLDEAYAAAKELPEEDQEAIGAWLLAEIESDRKWDELFASGARSHCSVSRRLLRSVRREGPQREFIKPEDRVRSW